jgi:chemotaxis methyl-accepting protein methylase
MTDARASEHALATAGHLLARRVGLRLDPALRGRLSRCVIEGALARNQDLTTYVASLDAHPAALQDLLNRVTVQETAFFRDPNQFAALAGHVLPGLAAPVTVWSAGCSNGQEPFSLAMALDESGCSAWRVLATDLSTRALERARRACYSTRELAGLSPERRARYFVAAGSAWEVTPALRARVEIAHHNLVGDPPPFEAGQCQVVFCRNVLIYFRHEEVVAFLDRLAGWLPPGGWLFLGYSESLWQVTDRFALQRLGDAFVYRREVGLSPTAAKRVWVPPAMRPSKQAPATPRPARRAPAPAPAVGDLRAAGEAAMTAGDAMAAIGAFRKCAYLDPDQPITHLHLGLALEAAGDPSAARRAYTAAQAALARRGDTGPPEVALEGYHVTALVRLLDDKLVELAPERRTSGDPT